MTCTGSSNSNTGQKRHSSSRQPLDEQWTKDATKAMKGKDPNSLVWNTPEGIPVKPVYTHKDLAEHAKNEVPSFTFHCVIVGAVSTECRVVKCSPKNNGLNET